MTATHSLLAMNVNSLPVPVPHWLSPTDLYSEFLVVADTAAQRCNLSLSLCGACAWWFHVAPRSAAMKDCSGEVRPPRRSSRRSWPSIVQFSFSVAATSVDEAPLISYGLYAATWHRLVSAFPGHFVCRWPSQQHKHRGIVCSWLGHGQNFGSCSLA